MSMNGWDVFLLFLICAAVVLAAVHIIRVRKSGGSLCGGDCSRCGAMCGRKDGR